jgi:hypothetical protein
MYKMHQPKANKEKLYVKKERRGKETYEAEINQYFRISEHKMCR